MRAAQEQKRQEQLERVCAANLEKQAAGTAGLKESFPSRAELAEAALVRDAQHKQVCFLLLPLHPASCCLHATPPGAPSLVIAC